MKIFTAFIILGLILALIVFGQVLPVPSVPPVPLTTIRAAANVHKLTAADVETFLDGRIVPLQLDRMSRRSLAGFCGAFVIFQLKLLGQKTIQR